MLGILGVRCDLFFLITIQCCGKLKLMVGSCSRAGATRRPIRNGWEDHVTGTVVEMQAAARDSGERQRGREEGRRERERVRERTWMISLRSGTESNSLQVVSLCKAAEQRGRHGQSVSEV
ncbi:hypothetical protein PHYPO_G00084290 [Pangasianodon hypophthalmus]|uniref:Uncharacterized protein n=1 Tax=Pangasianodon hypophthalmus TaxID=310915 RepID=A0A5N5LP04_PANHP|nr:hypothetical protein PHYPO_G00084290 [Pangasianodon hypophthalmus]